jgi:predicted ferric reductase
VKWFPYKLFFKTHRLLAVTYLLLVLHSVVLMQFSYWTTPLGIVLAVLMTVGSVAAVMSLARKHVSGVRTRGHIVGLEHNPALDVMLVDVAIPNHWPGHKAGQFAFVTFHKEEGAHPFTIASAWPGNDSDQPPPALRFLIKSLGDYTKTLPDRLRIGDPVNVEGPYGRFDFVGHSDRQIWVGGGIGITPFVARMKELARHPGDKPVDLIYATREHDPQIIERISEDARQAGIKLHVLWEERDGRLTPARLTELVPQWRQAEVWFCGPSGFGDAIRKGLFAIGLAKSRFHQELFEMR